MMETSERQEEVWHYYQIPPRIVHEVNRLQNTHLIWNEIATRYIKPALQQIQNGEYQIAHAIYRRMVFDLKNRYMGCKTNGPVPTSGDKR